MSDFGSFVSRFHDSTNILRRFDDVLRYLRKPHVQKNPSDIQDEVRELLSVLRPVAETLNGKLTETINLDAHGIVGILQQRHLKHWQQYRESVIRLAKRLESKETGIAEDDFRILNDIADAMDTECASLFRRMSGRI